LGLGLALAKGLVALHGGEANAASDGLGCGSAISIQLPLEQAHEKISETVESAAEPARPWRILIVEDNPVAARSTQLFLTHTGHSVAVAHSGREGLETALRFRPNVVLCDIGLPEMDGYVAHALRRELGAAAYLIAVTGYGQDEHQRRAREAGFDAYVTKPIISMSCNECWGDWI
jgi:CheY-like chemotaxis protein